MALQRTSSGEPRWFRQPRLPRRPPSLSFSPLDVYANCPFWSAHRLRVLDRWRWVTLRLHFGPGLSKFSFVVVASSIVLLCSALALAVFIGSVVCAADALRRERASRCVGGYLTLAAGVLSVLGLGAVYLRGFIIGH